MATDFHEVLTRIRDKAKNDKELGDIFEKICKIFFENDSIQKQQFSKVWHYKDWAKSRKEYSQTDIGIDLVAQIRDSNRFCAIQCKCYAPDHIISKADLDSFISASSTDDFKRLILIDTSNQDIGQNAKMVFKNLHKTYQRIQTYEFEQSRIQWLTYLNEDRVSLLAKKELRDHQIQAVRDVKQGFKKYDRGQMIMACGTGKTFASLRIAEELTSKGKLALYIVPTLALMSQTVREWKNDCTHDFTAFSACSDIKVGKRKPTDDRIEISLTDLAFPATTNPKELAIQVKKADPKKMIVVFSTYQSIDVISKAQFDYKLPNFEIIICDEAHRTTGATLTGEDESSFVKIHSNKNIKGKKRLYMTATPKIYGEKPKKKAEESEVTLASMDDENTFGPKFFYRGFNWAVENNLLSDYKVVILAVDEKKVSENLQKSFEEGAELKLDDATKIIGCYKALAKVGFEKDPEKREILKPINRALAFSQNIAISKIFKNEFKNVVDEYISNEKIDDRHKVDLEVEIEHIDGTFNADLRNERLNWLKEETDKNKCRILTNVRCLSEGVDVPTLDAILFLHPRKSQVDVVQSVGRVMRKASGKKLGYVILPITVAPGVSPEKAVNDSERYSVVWQVLNALRAHNDKFDNTINRLKLGEDVSDKIEIVLDDELEALTTTIEDLKDKHEPKKNDKEEVVGLNQNNDENIIKDEEKQLAFEIGDLSQAIKAKIVDKCGTRDYWENWANDIAKIARAHITRINSLVLNSKRPERKTFLSFLAEIRDDLNPEISENDAVEMLAQHIITKPVFETLFHGNEFTKDNPISKAMEKILGLIYKNKIEDESGSLKKFYDSVKRRSAGIISSRARQTLVLELYDRFFRNAFPILTEKLGIVYTPIEVVDFIIHSVNDLLGEEFNKSFNDKNVHILDPFTGTGTFMTRLLQSGLIKKQNLAYKYKEEMHANEIVLLAYYIAGINIESVYQDLIKENQYQPFNGIVLTDTFNLYEQERDMIADLLPDNSNKRTAQKKRKITAIFSNPPYSAGQTSADDQAGNVSYKNLDEKIAKTYASSSTAILKHDLYDSYIRAFRWATDRIEDEGIIGFVTNAGWIDGNATDGLRKNFHDEFNKIYIFNLRGNQRTSGELSRKEGGKIFGSGSRSPIAITLLVKNKKSSSKGEIYYYDIGDYLDRKKKLNIIKNFLSYKEIKSQNKFQLIKPDKNNDWINQGDERYSSFISLGDKRNKNRSSIFTNYSLGIGTNRDTWCYNFSNKKLTSNITKLIKFYNSEVNRLKNVSKEDIKNEINVDKNKISWTRGLISHLSKKTKLSFNEKNKRIAFYRPFIKTNIYSDKNLNESPSINSKIFPNQKIKNRIICVSGIGARGGFSTLMLNTISDLNMLEGGTQCFPLNLYYNEDLDEGLFANQKKIKNGTTVDGITNLGLDHFKKSYKNNKVTKENLFYYIYGIFHSTSYINRFKNNFSKEIPRIPVVKSFEDFMLFSKAGRKLGDLHINYETVKPYEVTFNSDFNKNKKSSDLKSFYYVKNMKFFGKRTNFDKTKVIYNQNIAIHNIPLEAYKYVVNRKPALEWIMEFQNVSTNKESGILNDVNDYANEIMKNPAYPLELFQRIITVSLETMKIIKNLPKLEIK